MGRGSVWLYRRARGVDEREILDNGPRVRKSISKDRTFMEDVEPENIPYLHEALKKMCTRIGEKLKNKALSFKTVTVKIRYEDYATIQRSKSIPVASDETSLLEKIAIDVFDQKRNHNKSIRLVGVKVSHLSEVSEQMCLTEFL